MNDYYLMKRIRSNPRLDSLKQILLGIAVIILAYLVNFFLIKQRSWKELELDIFLLMSVCLTGQLLLLILRKRTLNWSLIHTLYQDFHLDSIQELKGLSKSVCHQFQESKCFAINRNQIIGMTDYLLIDNQQHTFHLLPVEKLLYWHHKEPSTAPAIVLGVKGSEERLILFKTNRAKQEFIEKIETSYCVKQEGKPWQTE